MRWWKFDRCENAESDAVATSVPVSDIGNLLWNGYYRGGNPQRTKDGMFLFQVAFNPCAAAAYAPFQNTHWGNDAFDEARQLQCLVCVEFHTHHDSKSMGSKLSEQWGRIKHVLTRNKGLCDLVPTPRTTAGVSAAAHDHPARRQGPAVGWL